MQYLKLECKHESARVRSIKRLAKIEVSQKIGSFNWFAAELTEIPRHVFVSISLDCCEFYLSYFQFIVRAALIRACDYIDSENK